MQFFKIVLTAVVAALAVAEYDFDNDFYDNLVTRGAQFLRHALLAQRSHAWHDGYEDLFLDARDLYEESFAIRDEFDDRDVYDLALREALDENDGFSVSNFAKRTGNLDIYIAFGKRRNPHEALHWMIVATPENSNSATYYHVTGGPTQGKPFKPEIQAGKRLDSNGIGDKVKLSTIPESEKNKLKAAAQSAALPGGNENCQNYVVNVMEKLEAKGLVPVGTAQKYNAQIEQINSRSKTPPIEEGTEEIIEGKASPSHTGASSKGNSSPNRSGSPRHRRR